MKKILIIDDEERIRDLYTRLFVEQRFIVRHAPDAVKATNILIRENIDVILLDLKMPEINGKTMYEVIEQYDPNLKVIVSSVYPISKQKQMVPRATEYFDKSQGLNVLIEKVNSVLSADDLEYTEIDF